MAIISAITFLLFRFHIISPVLIHLRLKSRGTIRSQGGGSQSVKCSLCTITYMVKAAKGINALQNKTQTYLLRIHFVLDYTGQWSMMSLGAGQLEDSDNSKSSDLTPRRQTVGIFWQISESWLTIFSGWQGGAANVSSLSNQGNHHFQMVFHWVLGRFGFFKYQDLVQLYVHWVGTFDLRTST